MPAFGNICESWGVFSTVSPFDSCKIRQWHFVRGCFFSLWHFFSGGLISVWHFVRWHFVRDIFLWHFVQWHYVRDSWLTTAYFSRNLKNMAYLLTFLLVWLVLVYQTVNTESKLTLSSCRKKMKGSMGALQRGRVGHAHPAGWAMAHPKFSLGGPQCIWPHQ